MGACLFALSCGRYLASDMWLVFSGWRCLETQIGAHSLRRGLIGASYRGASNFKQEGFATP